MVNASNTMLLFKRSVFCPAPAGDSITRKSIFDSLVSGCIPVLFSRASLAQYAFHVDPDRLDDISVYIPNANVSDGSTTFLTILRRISPARIRELQRNIERIAPSLQYAVVPSRLGDIGRWVVCMSCVWILLLVVGYSCVCIL